eukprot:362078-Chlamydomonas_euryale.AAC.2
MCEAPSHQSMQPSGVHRPPRAVHNAGYVAAAGAAAIAATHVAAIHPTPRAVSTASKCPAETNACSDGSRRSPATQPPPLPPPPPPPPGLVLPASSAARGLSARSSRTIAEPGCAAGADAVTGVSPEAGVSACAGAGSGGRIHQQQRVGKFDRVRHRLTEWPLIGHINLRGCGKRRCGRTGSQTSGRMAAHRTCRHDGVWEGRCGWAVTRWDGGGETCGMRWDASN